MLTIVIPAAGTGTRFRQAGYAEPKPLIPVLGVPMIDRVLTNVTPRWQATKTLLIHRGELNGVRGEGVVLDSPTAGALETILRAEDRIDPDGGLLLANCDQLVAFDADAFVAGASEHDGALVVFPSSSPHHSYVETDDDGVITRIVEKEVISRHAVSGVYYFSRASMFLEAARRSLRDDRRVHGEYYVSVAVSLLIELGASLVAYPADTAILGTPDELQLFEAAARVAGILG